MAIEFSGKVIEGDKRGRELGYPTANIPLDKEIEEGIYISLIRGDGLGDASYGKKKELPSLTFIGVAKTFDKIDYKAEVYILDFNKDIYGEICTVRLLKKLRGNKKFHSAEDLIIQMKKDEDMARKYFSISSSSK